MNKIKLEGVRPLELLPVLAVVLGQENEDGAWKPGGTGRHSSSEADDTEVKIRVYSEKGSEARLGT